MSYSSAVLKDNPNQYPSWQPAYVGYKQLMPDYRDCNDFKFKKTDPSIKYATIVYINNDYVDGELFFPNLDIQLKPKPGTMLFFPGNKEYEHGVKHVGDGPIRYVLVGFIKEKDHYTKNKY